MSIQVAVVGGGWAGLAAAAKLTQLGYETHLFESAKQLGGRARSVVLDEYPVDNGQHLFTGACTAVFELLFDLGLDPSTCFDRQPFEWNLSPFLFKAASIWPAPFHFLTGLIQSKGIRGGEKWLFFKALMALHKTKGVLPSHLKLKTWLEDMKQSKTLIDLFWKPLCLAVLNTPFDKAAAQPLVRVLWESTQGSASHTDYVFSKVPLGELLPFAVQRLAYLDTKLHLHLSSRVKAFEPRPHGKWAVQDKEVDFVVCATSPWNAIRLFSPFSDCEPLCQMLSHLTYQPIRTAYLQYPLDFKLEAPLLGFNDDIIHWLLNRGKGLLAVVSSTDEGVLKGFNAQQFCAAVEARLDQYFPHWPQPIWIKGLVERRATFECLPNTVRPSLSTPLSSVFLAGDYVDSAYPATLEGAVRSGLAAASAVNVQAKMLQ